LVAAKVFNGPLGAENMVSTIAGLAQVFEPVAGTVGTWIFALGYFAAAFSAMTANATAGGIMLSDALGHGASASTKTARIFSGIILTWGVLITAIFGGKSPVALIVLAQSLTVLTAPILAFLLVYLSSRADFMGNLRNRWWQVALGITAFGVVFWFWIQLIIGFFN